jgi:hypothetical protein
MVRGKLYGSEPPNLDTVWESIRRKAIEVEKFERNSSNKEKEVDGALIADVTLTACKTPLETRGVVIIITGDRDPLPGIKALINEGLTS